MASPVTAAKTSARSSAASSGSDTPRASRGWALLAPRVELQPDGFRVPRQGDLLVGRERFECRVVEVQALGLRRGGELVGQTRIRVLVRQPRPLPRAAD